MSSSSHVTDLLPAYALDCLDDEDLLLVAEHVSSCEQCQAELQSFQSVVDQLAFLAPEASPSADLKDRFMSRLHADLSQPVIDLPKRRVPWWNTLGRMLQRTAPAWGTVCLLIAIGLGTKSWTLWRQLHPPVNEGMAEHDHMGEMFDVVRLGCTPEAPDAAGELMIGKDGRYAVLVVVGLPPLQPGYMYQLWAVDSEQRKSSDMFEVTSHGYGSMTISIPQALLGYSQFIVTVEPAAGSPIPSGARVLETRI